VDNKNYCSDPKDFARELQFCINQAEDYGKDINGIINEKIMNASGAN
jgi:hypothetical protein